MFLEVATEVPFPEDAMKKMVALGRVPLEDARVLGTVVFFEESPPHPHAPLPAEDAPSAGCSPPVGPAGGPTADWLRRRAEVMLLSLVPQAPGNPRRQELRPDR